MRDFTKQRVHTARHYAENKAYYVEKARRREAETRAYLITLKSKPCMDCGGLFPACCMDFDHVRGEKKFHITTQGPWVSRSRLEAELAKCDVVCANCHRIRTEARRVGPSATG